MQHRSVDAQRDCHHEAGGGSRERSDRQKRQTLLETSTNRQITRNRRPAKLVQRTSSWPCNYET